MLSQSVEGNYLVLPECGKIQIYNFNADGSIELTKKFRSLYGIFRPPLKYTLKDRGPPILPKTQVVKFQGTKDIDTNFMIFRRIDGIPNAESSITNEGIALHPYNNRNGNALFTKIDWEGSQDIQIVNFYFFQPGDSMLRLGYDANHLDVTQYRCNHGSVIFPNFGYIYVQVFSTSNVPTMKLTATAIANVNEPPFKKLGKVCLSFTECCKLFSISIAENINEITHITVPDIQWQFISNLIAKTYDEITSRPIPLSPLTRLVTNWEVRSNGYNDMQSVVSTTNRKRSTSSPRYSSASLYENGVLREQNVCAALQDGNNIFYSALQPILPNNSLPDPLCGQKYTAINTRKAFAIFSFVFEPPLPDTYNIYVSVFHRLSDMNYPSYTFYTSESDRDNKRNPVNGFLDITGYVNETPITIYFDSVGVLVLELNIYSQMDMTGPPRVASKLAIHYTS